MSASLDTATESSEEFVFVEVIGVFVFFLFPASASSESRRLVLGRAVPPVEDKEDVDDVFNFFTALFFDADFVVVDDDADFLGRFVDRFTRYDFDDEDECSFLCFLAVVRGDERDFFGVDLDDDPDRFRLFLFAAAAAVAA